MRACGVELLTIGIPCQWSEDVFSDETWSAASLKNGLFQLYRNPGKVTSEAEIEVSIVYEGRLAKLQCRRKLVAGWSVRDYESNFMLCLGMRKR